MFGLTTCTQPCRPLLSESRTLSSLSRVQEEEIFTNWTVNVGSLCVDCAWVCSLLICGRREKYLTQDVSGKGMNLWKYSPRTKTPFPLSFPSVSLPSDFILK